MIQILDEKNLKIPSLNSAYGYNPHTKRRYLNKDHKTYKDFIISMTTKVDIGSKHFGLVLHLGAYMDLTNCLKLTEDAICEKLDLNDRNTGEVHAKKTFLKKKELGFIKAWIYELKK